MTGAASCHRVDMETPGAAAQPSNTASDAPILFVLVGLPGSGKTTRARQLEEAHRAIRLTPDEWMIPLFGEREPDLAHDEVNELIRQRLHTLCTT